MPNAINTPTLATSAAHKTAPAIANERLTLNRAGQVVLTLKTAYRDSITHIVMSPLEFTQRLAAVVSRPRLHLIRFHGVLACVDKCHGRSCAPRSFPAHWRKQASTQPFTRITRRHV
jgi:Putative transposase